MAQVCRAQKDTLQKRRNDSVSAVTTPAVLLRSYNYSETSRILRFYTLDLGLVGVMAKGIRKGGGQGRSGLETFSRGDLTLYVRPTRDLQTFKEFDLRESGGGLGRDVVRFAAASVLAELVLVHAESQPSPEVFGRLTAGLKRVDEIRRDDVVAALLNEGWMLVSAFGYQPQLDPCVHCGNPLTEADLGRFDFGAGGVRCPGCALDIAGPLIGPGAREQLDALLQGPTDMPITKPKAHLQLLHDFTLYHISGSKALQSFRFLASVAQLEVDTFPGVGADAPTDEEKIPSTDLGRGQGS